MRPQKFDVFDEFMPGGGATLSHADEAHVRLWFTVMYWGITDACFQYMYRQEEEKQAGRSLPLRDAERWFESDERTAGSFVWCCWLFDMDPDVVRAAVIRRRPELAKKSVRM